MFVSALRFGWLLTVPGGLLLAAAVAAFHWLDLPAAVRAFLPYYPPLVAAAGLFLGWRFNRSRLVFAVVALALADRALALPLEGVAARLAAAAVALLLPLNLALLATWRERGIFSPVGMARFGLLLAQPLAVVWLARVHGEVSLFWLTRSLLETPLLEAAPLPQPALAAALLALAFLAFRFVREPAPLESGFLWALAATLPALAAGTVGPTRSLYLATAGLILVAAVVEASYSMAFRDELTGLPARRALNEALQKVGRRYTLAMVDIDHFKQFNDRHGHDVGDQVLKMVASKLARVTGGGRAFRYGGEEFTILFPGRDAEAALPHLEALREEVAAAGFVLRHRSRPQSKPQGGKARKKGERRLSVTVSIGLAERQPQRSLPEQVVKTADQALYRAKSAGRNRVCS